MDEECLEKCLLTFVHHTTEKWPHWEAFKKYEDFGN